MAKNKQTYLKSNCDQVPLKYLFVNCNKFQWNVFIILKWLMYLIKYWKILFAFNGAYIVQKNISHVLQYLSKNSV